MMVILTGVKVLSCCCVVTELCLVLLQPHVGHQAPMSMGFSRQEHQSGLPFPSPEDLPDPGMEAMSPALAAGFFTWATWAAQCVILCGFNLHFPNH